MKIDLQAPRSAMKRSRFFSLLLSLVFLPVATLLQAQTTPVVLWTPPAPVPFLTPVSGVELNARALSAAPVPVSLSSSYNVVGISTNGVTINNGGFDDGGWTFSSELLGSSVSWQGITFPLGPANQPNTVNSATIPLPSGTFSSLLVLGDLVNQAVPPTGTFILHYTDGSTDTVTQSLSDWVIPKNYTGESLATCTPTRHNIDGSTDYNSVCIYGYQFAVDPARTVASLEMPQNRNIMILSLVLLPPPVAGTFSYTPASGTVLTPGTHPLTANFTPTGPYTTASASVPFVVDPPVPLVTPTIDWPTPAPVPAAIALGPDQLDATASAPLGPTAISLAPYFRVNALYQDGSIFYERGFDGTSTAFSSNQLGTVLHYAGANFPLGPLAVPDAVTSSTIALPAGNFNTLYLLGAAATTPQLAQTFTVTYTDGTTSTPQISLSTWRQAQQFTGETIVASTSTADLSTGLQTAGTFNVYGYQLPVDITRTVASLTLPDNTEVILLAAGLGTQANYTVPGNFVYNPPAGTIVADSTTLYTTFTPTDTADFTPASASTLLIVGAQDFTLTPGGDMTMTAITGESPSVTFNVAPLNFLYKGTVTFSIHGNLPPLGYVTFSPTSIPADGGAQSVVLTVHTRKLASLTPFNLRGASTGVALCLLLFVPVAFSRKRSRLFLALTAALFLGLLPTGCGSGYADHVYNLTLVATDGTYTHTLPVVLHIEASPQ